MIIYRHKSTKKQQINNQKTNYLNIQNTHKTFKILFSPPYPKIQLHQQHTASNVLSRVLHRLETFCPLTHIGKVKEKKLGKMFPSDTQHYLSMSPTYTTHSTELLNTILRQNQPLNSLIYIIDCT